MLDAFKEMIIESFQDERTKDLLRRHAREPLVGDERKELSELIINVDSSMKLKKFSDAQIEICELYQWHSMTLGNAAINIYGMKSGVSKESLSILNNIRDWAHGGIISRENLPLLISKDVAELFLEELEIQISRIKEMMNIFKKTLDEMAVKK